MIHNVLRNVFGAAGSISGNVVGQNVNGLLIGANRVWNAADYLTVSVKSVLHDQIVAVNRVPMIALAHISDHEMGFSEGLQTLLNAGLAIGDYTDYHMFVPLGCLKNRATDSTLEILLEAGAAGTFSVATVFNDDGTDYVLKTLQSNLLKDTFSNCDKLFIFRNAATLAPSGLDLSVMVQSPYGATVCNALDLATYTAAMGELEAQGPTRVLCVYDSPEAQSSRIDAQITGTDAANWSMIHRAQEVNKIRVSRGNLEVLNRAEQMAEGRPVEEQKALVRAGKALDLSMIRTLKRRWNDGMKSGVGTFGAKR